MLRYLDKYKFKTQLFFKKCSILRVILPTLLIMCGAFVGLGQELKDTVVLNNEDITSPIYYSADDSIYADLRSNVIHLYGNASVDNGEVVIKAGYIVIDIDGSEIAAEYIFDSDSNKIQFPEFTDGSEEIKAQRVRYNFDSEKAFIEEVALQQDENFLYMGIAKRQKNEQIHFRKGRFTTCDLEEPHYHFQLSKAVMVPEKRIVSGPMNLWVKGVPTPLGLPFAIIPQAENKAQGLLFHQIAPLSNFGFGFQDLGYYIPINDHLQTTFYATLYSRGTWGISNKTQYASKYKFRGDLNLKFQQFKQGFPDSSNINKSTIRWVHSKDQKSNPYWNFNTNINFTSDNQPKNSLDNDNPDYFNNTLKSDINISRTFPSKPISMGAKISLSQNSKTNNIALTSPILNVNVTSFYPLKRFVKPTKRGGFSQLISRLAVNYNFEGKNESIFHDSLLREQDFIGIQSSFKNGLNQNVSLATTAGLFKNTWKITPTINYSNKINFQQTERIYEDSTVNSTIKPLTGMGQTLSFNASATTVLYSYYRFIGKRNSLLRHVLTPSFSYSYRPNLNENDTLVYGPEMNTIIYSPFENSSYSTGLTRAQSLFTFGFNNTFELKQKDDNDTVTGFRKIRIVDAFSIRGSYDFLDTLTPLSNITSNLRVSPTKWLNLVANATFSPYGWNDTTGADLFDYATNTSQGLGRFKTINFATTFTLTSKKGRERLGNAIDEIDRYWNADYDYYMLHPEEFLDFRIPWKLSLSHVYGISANTNISPTNSDQYITINTLMINGDVSFTKRWKLGTRTNVDMKGWEITNSLLTLTRDMHCWALSFRWTPIGTNKSFMFTMRATSQLFQDAKIELKKPPAFL